MFRIGEVKFHTQTLANVQSNSKMTIDGADYAQPSLVALSCELYELFAGVVSAHT